MYNTHYERTATFIFSVRSFFLRICLALSRLLFPFAILSPQFSRQEVRIESPVPTSTGFPNKIKKKKKKKKKNTRKAQARGSSDSVTFQSPTHASLRVLDLGRQTRLKVAGYIYFFRKMTPCHFFFLLVLSLAYTPSKRFRSLLAKKIDNENLGINRARLEFVATLKGGRTSVPLPHKFAKYVYSEFSWSGDDLCPLCTLPQYRHPISWLARFCVDTTSTQDLDQGKGSPALSLTAGSGRLRMSVSEVHSIFSRCAKNQL